MLVDIFLTISPILCTAIGTYYMYRIAKMVKPMLQRLDELKKLEDRIVAWERDKAMWEVGTYVKLELEGPGQRGTDSEDLPF